MFFMRGKFLAIIIFAFIVISGCTTQEKHTLIFKGTELHFRADLNKAKNIKVFPSEEELSDMLLNKSIEKITIAFPNVTKASYYAVAGYELAWKLTFIYNSIYAPFSNPRISEENNYTCLFYPDFDKKICIGNAIFDTDGLNTTAFPSMLSRSERVVGKAPLLIVLLGEGFANETEIVVEKEKNIIFVKGKSFSQKNRKYTDLDLAVDKLLLVLFNKLSNS